MATNFLFMQVTFKLENFPGCEGFRIECDQRPLTLYPCDNTAMRLLSSYKSSFVSSFGKETVFKYRNVDGSKKVASFISKLLTQDIMRTADQGLQRLSASVIARNPASYPSTMLSNKNRVPQRIKAQIDQAAEELKETGLITA